MDCRIEIDTVGVAVAVGVHFARKGGWFKGNNLWDDYTDKDFMVTRRRDRLSGWNGKILKGG